MLFLFFPSCPCDRLLYQCAVDEEDDFWKTLHLRPTTRTPPRLSGPAASMHEEYSVVL